MEVIREEYLKQLRLEESSRADQDSHRHTQMRQIHADEAVHR